MLKRARGFTLIELIIYLVIVGFLAVAILTGMSTALQQSPQITQITQAAFLAQQRMEVIAGYKMANGFSSFVDPCDAPATFPDQLCSAGAFAQGFSVSSTITPSWESDANLTLVAVTVSGGDGASTFTTVMGNYE